MKRSAAAGLIACCAVFSCGDSGAGGSEGDGFVPADAAADFHGIVLFAADGVRFQPCGMALEFPVADSTNGELVQAFRDLVNDPFGTMYVEVRGRYDPYDPNRAPERFLLNELRRSAFAVPGCEEDIEGILFRAAGAEPAWLADVMEDRIVFSAGADGALLEFGAPEVKDSVGLEVFIATAPAGDTLRIVIHPVRCIDEHTGARYSFGAEARLGAGYFVGCAAAGWP